MNEFISIGPIRTIHKCVIGNRHFKSYFPLYIQTGFAIVVVVVVAAGRCLECVRTRACTHYSNQHIQVCDVIFFVETFFVQQCVPHIHFQSIPNEHHNCMHTFLTMGRFIKQKRSE